MKKNQLLYIAAFLLVLVALAGTMLVIGRGHTVYFDNKTLEMGDQTYPALYRVKVYIKGKTVADLRTRERGMTTNMGQNFSCALGIIREKGGEEEIQEIALTLPYSMDGIILNLPGYLAGLPQESYLSEFIATPTEEEMQEEAPVGGELEGELSAETF